MVYKLYLVAILNFFLLLTHAQEVLLSEEKYPEMKYLGISGKVYFNEYQQIRGSGFLSDDWITGDVYLKDGSIIKGLNLKIDLYAQQILLYHDLLKRILILEKNNINNIILHDKGADRKFTRLEMSRSKSFATDGTFVEVLAEGKLSFYKLYYKERIFLSTPVKPYIYEFIDGKEFRLNYNNNNTKISLNKRALFKMFPENKVEIKHYIRTSHLKLKNEADFAKAVDYINELKK